MKKINVKFTAGTATPELISESEDSFQNKFVRVELPSLGYAMLAEKESTNVTTRVIPSQTRAMAPKYRYAIK